MTMTPTPGVTTASPARFDPPGKGEWRSMADHFPRACTAEYRRLLAGAMEAGEAEHFAAYGMPARTLRPEFVHGHVYLGAVPLIGKAANALPPAPILKLAARLHPAFRKRERAARRALDEGLAVAEAERWRRVDRALWHERNAAVEAIDPGALDDAGLAAHLVDVRTLCDDGYREHFRLHGCDLLPTALLLVFTADRGIAAGDVLALLVGHRWLAPDALVVVERATRSPEPRWPAGLGTAEERRYGETRMWFADAAGPDAVA